jgi:hypothetical protein
MGLGERAESLLVRRRVNSLRFDGSPFDLSYFFQGEIAERIRRNTCPSLMRLELTPGGAEGLP